MQCQNSFAHHAPALLQSLPSAGNLQSGWYKGLKNLVRSRGRDPARILEQHDIDPAQFEDCNYHVDCSTAVNLMQSCSRMFNDPLFGLHLAEQQDPDVFGCAVALARAAPTVRQALESLVEYVPAFSSPDAGLEFVEIGSIAELRWWTVVPLGDAAQQVNYQGLLLTMKTLRMLGRERFRPRYATLTCEVGRRDTQALHERLGCKVTGRASANAVAFSADMLRASLPTANELLFNLLEAGLTQLREQARPGFAEQVAAYVRRALPTGRCCVEDCAAELGTSPRTLQKRLTRMRVAFSDIVQSERIKLAKQALLWTSRSLDEIAFQLGYSEQTSFGRAFKRVVGATPQAFRSASAESPLSGADSVAKCGALQQQSGVKYRAAV